MSATVNTINTTTTSTPTPSTLKLADIKRYAHGDVNTRQYFARDIGGAIDGAYEKGGSIEQLAITTAGSCFERAHSGNTEGLSTLRSRIERYKLAKRHAIASTLETLLAYAEGQKPKSIKPDSYEDAEHMLETFMGACLAILNPPKAETKPRATPTNWKQECLNARAERDAALAKLAECQAALAKLQA